MTIGPLARNACDLALVLRIMAGPDALDGGAVPVPFGDPAGIALERISVAWCDGEGTVPVAAEVRATVSRAAAALEGKVARVIKSRPPGLDEAAPLFANAQDAEGMPEVAAIVAGQEDRLGDFMRAYLSAARPAASFARICKLAGERDALRARVLGHFAEHAILLLPVAAVAAPRPQATVAVDGVPVAWREIGACCRAISLFGLPAAAVPFGASAAGLPIGVQVVGRPFHDHEVLAVAGALEHFQRG